jgi:hypothetical protein
MDVTFKKPHFLIFHTVVQYNYISCIRWEVKEKIKSTSGI